MNWLKGKKCQHHATYVVGKPWDACGSNEVSRSSLGEVGPELNFLKNIYTFIYLFGWGLRYGMQDLRVTHGLSGCGSKA